MYCNEMNEWMNEWMNKRIVGSKNTLNLKIIDQIYYFRYALLQNKELEKIAIKVASEVTDNLWTHLYEN